MTENKQSVIFELINYKHEISQLKDEIKRLKVEIKALRSLLMYREKNNKQKENI